MNRRASLLITAAAVVFAAVLAWLVVRSDEPEPCRTADGCVVAFTVELDELGLVDAAPARTALAGRDSSEGIFIAVEGRRSGESERTDRIVVVATSAETGTIEQVLVDRSGQSASLAAFTASPDGSVLAVALVMVEDDGSESREAVLIDVASGDVISTAQMSDLAGSCLLSFAADNTRFECSGLVYDVQSGELLGGTEEFEAIEIESRWVRMGFRTALDVQADPDEGGNEIRLRIDGEERTFAAALSGIDDPERGELSFRPDGDRLIHHRSSSAADQAEIVVYRTDDQTEVDRLPRNSPVHDVTWLDEDLLVTITVDFDVVIYQID